MRPHLATLETSEGLICYKDPFSDATLPMGLLNLIILAGIAGAIETYIWFLPEEVNPTELGSPSLQ